MFDRIQIKLETPGDGLTTVAVEPLEAGAFGTHHRQSVVTACDLLPESMCTITAAPFTICSFKTQLFVIVICSC